MKKLLYITCVNLDDEVSGITRKVFSQFNAMTDRMEASLIGYWGKDVKFVSGESERIIDSKGLHRRLAVMNNAVRIVKERSIDHVYIRRFQCNPLVIRMLKQLKKAGAKKIIWEIPTYPYEFESGNSFRANLVRNLDRHYRKQLKKYVDRIVTFAPDKEIFGIPAINTGNGIDVDSIRPRKIAEHSDEIHMIATAILNNWHGYDRLIRGLAKYKGDRRVVFHLVGNGPCFDEYKALAVELGVNDKIIFYGAKSKSEMEDIYDLCDLAVESLGWHRSQVKVGTSLKTREYVAKGMPILASSPMDIFPAGWEYAFYAPIDDSPIDIQTVIEFYDTLYKDKTKEELAEEIRKIAYERCDMKAMMKPVIDFFIYDSNN